MEGRGWKLHYRLHRKRTEGYRLRPVPTYSSVFKLLYRGTRQGAGQATSVNPIRDGSALCYCTYIEFESCNVL